MFLQLSLWIYIYFTKRYFIYSQVKFTIFVKKAIVIGGNRRSMENDRIVKGNGFQIASRERISRSITPTFPRPRAIFICYIFQNPSTI